MTLGRKKSIYLLLYSKVWICVDLVITLGWWGIGELSTILYLFFYSSQQVGVSAYINAYVNSERPDRLWKYCLFINNCRGFLFFLPFSNSSFLKKSGKKFFFFFLKIFNFWRDSKLSPSNVSNILVLRIIVFYNSNVYNMANDY